jgi:hypothetical protein
VAAPKAANVCFGDIHTFGHLSATLMDSLKIPGAVKRLCIGHAGLTVADTYSSVIQKDDRSAAEQIDACLSRRRLRIRIPSLPPFFRCQDFGEVQTVSGIRIRCHACSKSSSRS